MFEIGFLLAKKKKVEFIQEPIENWLIDVVDYFSVVRQNIIKA